MIEEKDHIRDLAEIRSMMERSSKFLSLSGWAGIMAGVYALAGAYIAYNVFHFAPGETYDGTQPENLAQVSMLAVGVLMLAVSTAIFLSGRKARRRDEKMWNATSRRLVEAMAVPLFAGGLLILILLSKGLIGLLVPATLIFYGLSLYNASRFTYDALKFLGLIQVGLGLLSAYFVQYGLLFWAIGFGVVHIVYGIYIHYRYER